MRHYTRLLDANRENKELRSGSLHDVKRQEEAKMNGDNHFVISEKMWIWIWNFLTCFPFILSYAYDYRFTKHLHYFSIQK